MRNFVVVLLVALAAMAGPALAASDDDDDKRAALLAGYPGQFVFDGNEVVFPSGTRIVWDDGEERNAIELIAAPDVEDMFHYVYPLAAQGSLTPSVDFDPGRIRNEAFFKALYGDSARAVDFDHRPRRHQLQVLTQCRRAPGTILSGHFHEPTT